MSNTIWRQEEQKFREAMKSIKIPDGMLKDVPYIAAKSFKDFDKIPESGGCYWIWTNEPVLHSLHKNGNPPKFDGGEIIYNGIAKDNVRNRAIHHLLGHIDAGWSGISLDIHFGATVSHRKKAFSARGKVPYIKESKTVKKSTKKSGLTKGQIIEIFQPIRTKDDLVKIHLSAAEQAHIKTHALDKIYFRNGIDIREDKHKNYEFRVYFITDLESLYLDFIEKKWRKEFGLPKLCSYSSGR